MFVWSTGTDMSARTRTIGADRIVSFESLPDSDACLMPGAETENLSAAVVAMERMASRPEAPRFPVCALPPHLAQSQGTVAQSQGTAADGPAHIVGGPGTAYQARTRSGQIDRAPLHFVKDPYAAWSSVAVNAENDMVILTDENLFRIVEFSRKDNTPATGPVTVPRRVIGGDNTFTEMLCGSYIDPKTLEVYVTNNDTQDWMPVFSREARGNVKPDRLLATPHRGWGIAADEIRQELYMTIQPEIVIVYRKTASGTEVPLRMLEGPATQLADPHGIAVDVKNDVFVVANHGHRQVSDGPPPTLRPVEEWRKEWEEEVSGVVSHGYATLFQPQPNRREYGRFEQPSINIYARTASGNTAPLRVIKGPRTRLNWPGHVAVHPDSGEIFVANDSDDSIVVFRVTDNGDVAPQRVLRGPRTNVKNPSGVAVDAVNGELWVASMGNHHVGVFPITANGDVAPLRTIRGGPAGREGLMIGNPGAIGYDNKRQEVLVPN